MFTFFTGPHVGRPTVGTKLFDSASNSILSDGPTGQMINRSSCLNMQCGSQWQCIQVGHHRHVRDRVSCLLKHHGRELNFISIHLSGYGGVHPQVK